MGLAFIDFQYFSDELPPPLFGHRGQREERAAWSVWSLTERERRAEVWPLSLYPGLSGFCLPVGARAHRSAFGSVLLQDLNRCEVP